MTPIREMKNIGPVTADWLEEIGIQTEADLDAMGAVEAYRKLKALYPNKVSLNLLYGLQAGLLGISYLHLPPEIKEELKQQVTS